MPGSSWRHLSSLLHLEIESFYIFAKILLDKIAHFVEDYFGPCRGVSLASHHKWCAALGVYSSMKNIKLPARFDALANELQTLIGDHRDKQFTHNKNPRVLRHTLISGDGRTSFGTAFIYRKTTDQEEMSLISA